MEYELREKLKNEACILQACCDSASRYLEEKETPFEQNLARSLNEQSWRLLETVDEIYNQ